MKFQDFMNQMTDAAKENARIANDMREAEQIISRQNDILAKINQGKTFYDNAVKANNDLHYSSNSPSSKLGFPPVTQNPFVETMGNNWTEDQKNTYYYLLADNKEEAQKYARDTNAFTDPSFKALSANRNFQNPTDDDFAYYDAMMNHDSWRTDATGKMYDSFGNEIPYIADDKGNILHPMQNEARFSVNDPLGLFLSTPADERENLVYGGNQRGLKFETLKEGVVNHWEKLEEEEISMYYYILNKRGKDKALEYLRDTSEMLNSRWGTSRAEEIKNIDNGFLKTVSTGLLGFEAGLDQWSTGIAQIFKGEALPTSGVQYASAEISDDLEGFGKNAYNATVTVGNMLPSILTSRVLVGAGIDGKLAGKIGAGVLGVSAGGNAYGQALKEGYSEKQAQTYGVLIAASEATLQSLLGGIGSLGGISDDTLLNATKMIDKSLLRLSAKFGIKLGSEIVEEELQNVLEPAFRTIIFGEKYDAPTIDEILETAIITALSTGALEGGSIISTDIHENRQLVGKGKSIMSAGGVGDLVDIADETSGISSKNVKKNIEKLSNDVLRKVNKGSTSNNTARKIGRLYDSVSDATVTLNKGDIVKNLTRKGFSKNKATTIAEAVIAKDDAVQSIAQKMVEYGYTFDEAKAIATNIVEENSAEYIGPTQSKLLNIYKNDERVKNAEKTILYNEQSTIAQRNQKLNAFDVGIALSRNTTSDASNPLRSTQSVLDSIDTGEVNIPSANTTNVDSDVYEQYNDNIEKDNGGNINGSQNTDLLAGRKVSAANRSGNSIREQSENTKKLNSVLGIRTNNKKGFGQKNAGSEGWLSAGDKKTSRQPLGFNKSFLGTLRNKPIKNTDSVGRKLSDKLLNKLNKTVLKDKNGTILSLYHFTDSEFEEFSKGDIGFHFGTLDAAIFRENDPSRTKHGNSRIYKEVYLKIENPVIIDFDPNKWIPLSTAHLLLRQGIFTLTDLKTLENLQGYLDGDYNSPASVKLRELLSQKGYDGIIYSNGVEGDVSVIALYPDQIITVAENGVLKEGVGVTEESDDDIDNSGTGSGFKEPSLNLSNEEKVNMAFGKTTNAPEYLDVIKLGEDLGLKAKDISFTVKFGLTRGNAVSKVVKTAFKNNAQYSQYFSSFEKVISESDMYKNWAKTPNKKNTTVLDFAIEICFGNNKSAKKQLADILSKDKNASKFIPTMLSDIYSKTGNRYGIESALKDLSYTFTEAAYDARHSESEDVFADKYAKDDSFWTAKNKNIPHKETANLKDKILSLFGKNSNNEKIPSISEIVKLIEESFKVPVSKGKFREKAYGIYKNKSEAIRTKVENALPTIAHELGHHLDKKHNLSSLPSIDEAVKVLKTERPNFFNSYSPKKHPHEAVAEFVRFYLADRTQAKVMYPNFFGEFEAAIHKNSLEDFDNIRTIGDKINSYFTADKAERAKTTVLTRAEAKKLNRRSVKLADVLEDAEIRFLDDAAALKKVSKKAYDLYYFAKKSSVRAKNTISGYYMSGFNGGLVEMRDKNGDIVKGEKGKPKYVPALAYILEGINDKQTQHDFDEYLIAKHGIYWIKNDLRVYADDTHNNVEFMQSQIEKFEKQYPKFKETAENLYSWYRTFIYEYGIKSGLLSKEQYTNMTTKYPCYVPFMRNVEANKRGIKGSLANQNAPIQRASGSGLDILSPIENIVIKVEQFMKAADRNAVMQEVADIADTAEGKGYLLEKVPPNLIPVTVAVKAEEGDLIDNAIMDTITEFKVANNQGENVVWVYRNGEKTYYQVHDVNLLSALTAMNKTQYNLVTKAAGNITRAFKALTTGGNAVWSLASNAPRDFSSAYKYSSENNPIKFTIDYIKAFKSAIAEAYLGDKAADEIIKLYKSMGGGFNNSLSNSGRELKLTIKEIFQKDKGIIKRITADFNFIEMIEKLADSVETAPRLAEFKRVYEKTGDAKAALKAAEEITVNFNRSGIHGKVIDQYIPYFNASLQGNRKLASTLADSLKEGGDKSFLVKTAVCGLVKVGLIFAINNLIMGDDDNDEYEKLSAYKKNNFYNIYIGDGKFISIPKAKDTAVFDSFLERTFEIAMKEDVEWSKEIEDFCAYIWLIFGPPLLDDTIGFSTALDLAANKDFTGAPIVPSNLEDLKPAMQYNENTTYIAKSLGKLFGYSPIKIDHIIDSNLGWFGLLNRSLGKEEKDCFLGVKTKIVTDNVYSSDSLNNFYDKAEHYASQTKSYPNDTDAAYNNKRYSSIRSIISEINQYGKEDEAAARDYRILAKNYADNYINEIAASKKLLDLFEKTQNTDILPYKSFSAEYSIDKIKYRMDSDDFMNYIEEYYSEIKEEYDDILKKGYSEETTIAMLIDAKKDVNKRVSDKYKVEQ